MIRPRWEIGASAMLGLGILGFILAYNTDFALWFFNVAEWLQCLVFIAFVLIGGCIGMLYLFLKKDKRAQEIKKDVK
jgi:hypothetical protein